ncbi:MAG: SDR family oxidoreductase [Oligoflexia bacterium]|nr:SDR family oxidoreductase [Oligoflexia bacterium]
MYKQKLIFITGGSEGIGLCVAKDFVKAQANVVILSRSKEKLNQATVQLEKLRQNKEQIIKAESLDVSNFNDVKNIFEKLFSEIGLPDYLINCAGFAYPGYIEAAEIDTYKQMMNVNYFGVVNTCKVFVENLLKNKSKAHIINTSSIAGYVGLFGYTGYCASKYAVIGFSQALKAELKKSGITVSVLCPPNTKTPGLEKENLIKPAELLKVEEKAKPVTAEEVSKYLLKKIPSKQFWIIPTVDGNLALYLSRLAPKILEQFTKRP